MKILPKDRTIKRTGLVMGRLQIDVDGLACNCKPHLNGIPLDNIVRVITDFHATANASYISVYYHDDNNDNDPEKMIRRRVFVTEAGKLDLDLTGEVFPEEAEEFRCFPTAQKIGTIERQAGFPAWAGAVLKDAVEAIQMLGEAMASAVKSLGGTLAEYDRRIAQAVKIDSLILKARRKGLDPQSKGVARQGRRQLALHRQARRTP